MVKKKEFESVRLLRKFLKKNPKVADKLFKKIEKMDFSNHPTVNEVLGKGKRKK